jgi:hypothetical protein
MRQHAIEHESHVVVFEELGYRQHAFGFRVSASGCWDRAACFASRDSRGGCLHMSRGGGCLYMSCGRAKVHNFFRQGEYTGLAGDDQEAVMGLATDPTRPLQATIIHRTVETVSCQRFRN